MSLTLQDAPLILASASPRRQELLSLYGIPFTVVKPEVEEHATGTGKEQALQLARIKGEDVWNRYPGHFVLAADTLVCMKENVMGKPKDEADAVRMIQSLSNRTHQVFTGICLFTPDGEVFWDVDTTDVTFLPLSDDIVRRYVQTGESMDKAGAYGIQGKAGVFIRRIEGSPSNVIGLPLGMLTTFFEKLGWHGHAFE